MVRTGAVASWKAFGRLQSGDGAARSASVTRNDSAGAMGLAAMVTVESRASRAGTRAGSGVAPIPAESVLDCLVDGGLAMELEHRSCRLTNYAFAGLDEDTSAFLRLKFSS